jgi:hypothetical protein
VGVGSGAAGSASVGYGFFSGCRTSPASWSGFSSLGGFVNIPGFHKSFVPERRERPFRGDYRSSHTNFALDAYGGGGLAIFWSPNANRVSDILGSAETSTVEAFASLICASLQRSVSPSSGIEAYSIVLPCKLNTNKTILPYHTYRIRSKSGYQNGHFLPATDTGFRC